MSFEQDLACPHCGRTNEAHAGVDDDQRPEPGDVSICWACRQPSLYTETGLRLPTAEEDAEIRSDPNVRQALAAMRESHTPSQANELRRGSS